MITQTPMLLGQSQLHPNKGVIKKRATGLIITSLVDAFTILVIYLLFGPSISGESVDPQMGINLPVAMESQLTDQETSLVIKNNHYYVDQREIASKDLVTELKKIAGRSLQKAGKALVIIADQSNDIEKLNPVLIAASEAGMSQLRLAVEHQGD